MKNILKYIPLIIMFLLLSWLVTCGLVKILTLCFDFDFSWKMATGVWVGLSIVQSIFSGVGK